jgi:hypothetical protein
MPIRKPASVPSRSATRKYSAVSKKCAVGRIQRQDGRSGGVVQGKDGIQLVLSHVADDDRHSRTPWFGGRDGRPKQRLSHGRPARGDRPPCLGMTFGWLADP